MPIISGLSYKNDIGTSFSFCSLIYSISVSSKNNTLIAFSFKSLVILSLLNNICSNLRNISFSNNLSAIVKRIDITLVILLVVISYKNILYVASNLVKTSDFAISKFTKSRGRL